MEPTGYASAVWPPSARQPGQTVGLEIGDAAILDDGNRGARHFSRGQDLVDGGVDLGFHVFSELTRRVSENKARKRSDLGMPAPIVRGEVGVYTTPGCLHVETSLAWLWPGRRHRRFHRCWRKAAIAVWLLHYWPGPDFHGSLYVWNADQQKFAVTGIVSGHREKALAQAAKYGVPEGSIYSYGTWTSSRTIRPSRQCTWHCPIVCMPGTPSARRARASTSCARSRWRRRSRIRWR